MSCCTLPGPESRLSCSEASTSGRGLMPLRSSRTWQECRLGSRHLGQHCTADTRLCSHALPLLRPSQRHRLLASRPAARSGRLNGCVLASALRGGARPVGSAVVVEEIEAEVSQPEIVELGQHAAFTSQDEQSQARLDRLKDLKDKLERQMLGLGPMEALALQMSGLSADSSSLLASAELTAQDRALLSQRWPQHIQESRLQRRQQRAASRAGRKRTSTQSDVTSSAATATAAASTAAPVASPADSAPSTSGRDVLPQNDRQPVGPGSEQVQQLNKDWQMTEASSSEPMHSAHKAIWQTSNQPRDHVYRSTARKRVRTCAVSSKRVEQAAAEVKTVISPGQQQNSKSRRVASIASTGTAVQGLFKGTSYETLLTHEQEVILSQLIQQQLRYESVKAVLTDSLGREPSVDEWAAECQESDAAAFKQKLHAGSEARKKMIECNQRLVVSVARRFQGRGLDMNDLVAEGIVGLIKGVERFDHRRGFKFSTYAHWWIRQAISRGISEQSRVIRLPAHMYEQMMRITKIAKEMQDELDRPPTTEELAKKARIPASKLHMITKAHRAPHSLDSLINSDDSNKTTLADLVPDDTEAPDQSSENQLMIRDLENVLYTLNPREAKVIRMRYGMDDGIERTLEEVGLALGVTRERIRQIEGKAVRKLKDPTRCSILHEYGDLGDTKMNRAAAARRHIS